MEVRFFEDKEKVKKIIAAWKSSNHELVQYYRQGSTDCQVLEPTSPNRSKIFKNLVRSDPRNQLWIPD